MSQAVCRRVPYFHNGITHLQTTFRGQAAGSDLFQRGDGLESVHKMGGMTNIRLAFYGKPGLFLARKHGGPHVLSLKVDDSARKR